MRPSITLLCVLLVTFARASAAGQPEASSPAAGRVLISNLNCTACHAASDTQASWITPKAGPRMADLGNRISGDWVTRYLAGPQEAMPGTSMPDLLGHLKADDRKSAAEALAHFLVSNGAQKFRRVMPDRAAVARGEALYHRVGCVACHAPQNAKLNITGAAPLPNMAEKWSFDGLRRFLKDPLATRPSGRMPAMNLTDSEAADIAHYLLRDTKVPATLELTQFRSRVRSLEELDTAELARTGPADDLTVAAMGRDRGYAIRLSGWLQVDEPGEYTFYLTAQGSSRLSVRGEWLLGEESWQREKVDGKKKIKLNAGWHAITVDFVQRGQKEPALKVEWEGPGIARQAIPASRLRSTREPVPVAPKFEVDAAKAAKGKALYAELNCAACHDPKPAAGTATALAALKPDQGCLADKPAGKAPGFAFDAAQKTAVRAALAELTQKELQPPTAKQRVQHTMAALNCVACHARDGIGGAAADRNDYFTSTGEDLGDEGRLPPHLTGVGDKLRPEWMGKVLTQAAAVRPYLSTRMPQFGEANVAVLPKLFVAVDRKPQPIKASPDAPDVQRDAGRKLVGTDGLSCIACHRFNRLPALTMQIIDLTTASERLNEDWFRQLLLDPNKFHPGTRMPAFWPEGKSLIAAVLNGDTDRQLSAIWTYLGDGAKAKFPEGLSRQNMELIVGGDPIVYRGKLWEAGFRAVAMGYPGQLNAAFDAEEMRLALLWRGRFLNASPHWSVQGMGSIRPLGTDVILFPHGSPMAVLADEKSPWPAETGKELGLKFHGYQIDKQQRPTLLYAFRETGIEDLFLPLEETGKAGFRRTITFAAAPPAGLYFKVAAGKLKPAGNNAWRLDDSMTITIPSGSAFVRGKGDQQELLVPVRFADNKRQVEVLYAW